MHGVRRVALAGVTGLMLTLAVSACSSSSGMAEPVGSEISKAPSEVSVAPTAVDPPITDSVTGEGGAASVVLVGDTGPGGGIVFYDAGSQQSWGRYLEAAPAGWSGSEEDPWLVWCPRDQPGYLRILGTGVDVGSGRSNTALIVEACGSDTAAGAAAGYRGGGKDDWFLPSKEELDVLYQQRAVVGALANDYFWSSSQSSASASGAWCQYVGNGNPLGSYKDIVNGVRPVRAF